MQISKAQTLRSSAPQHHLCVFEYGHHRTYIPQPLLSHEAMQTTKEQISL